MCAYIAEKKWISKKKESSEILEHIYYIQRNIIPRGIQGNRGGDRQLREGYIIFRKGEWTLEEEGVGNMTACEKVRLGVVSISSPLSCDESVFPGCRNSCKSGWWQVFHMEDYLYVDKGSSANISPCLCYFSRAFS